MNSDSRADLTFVIARPEYLSSHLGDMIKLCIEADVYIKWRLSGIKRLFLPPLQLGQAILCFESGKIVAFSTWALMDKEASQRLAKTYSDPLLTDWNSGNNAWVIDFVAPYGHARILATKIREDSLREYRSANSLRRGSNGTVTKIGRFMNPMGHLGVRIRKKASI